MDRGFDSGDNGQARIGQLIASFARSQPNLLKYSQVLMLMLDRCMLNDRLTLTEFHNLFIAASKSKSIPQDKSQVQGQKVLDKDQLMFLFRQSAKLLYHPDPLYYQKFFNIFLSDKLHDNLQINRSRVMVFDDTTRKILLQQGLNMLNEYNQQIKHLFICYMLENYWSLRKHQRILLSAREIVLQNKKWSYVSLIFFLKDSETCPHLVTVEHIQESLRMIVPNVNAKQQEFYSRHALADGYHKDIENHEDAYHAGDPGLMLFEFQLLLLKIALDSFPKQLDRKDMGCTLQRYLKYICLRKNEQLETHKLPSNNRRLMTKLKEYYQALQNDKLNSQKDHQQLQEEFQQPLQQLKKRINKQIDTAEANLDIVEIMKVLERELPKLPQPPIVQPQCPGAYDKSNAITIGKQPPPQIEDKIEKPKAQKKSQKKDEQPARQFKWADVPQTKFAAQDYLQKLSTKLAFEVQPLGELSRGVLKKEVYPVLIGQVLFPPELPRSVVPYLQAATNALIERNFLLAIENYHIGAATWKKTTVEFDPAAELFFEYSKGSMYLEAGNCNMALLSYFNSRRYADTTKLPFGNPDRSLPYCGLGQVFYQMQQYELAARSYLKARQIRQSVLGLQHIQAGCTFNNLACCFYMLGRAQQALGYIQIAEVVIDTELGSHHERTMTARSNLKKINRGDFVNKPEFRKFWQVFEEDKFQKTKKKKKKDDDVKKKK